MYNDPLTNPLNNFKKVFEVESQKSVTHPGWLIESIKPGWLRLVMFKKLLSEAELPAFISALNDALKNSYRIDICEKYGENGIDPNEQEEEKRLPYLSLKKATSPTELLHIQNEATERVAEWLRNNPLKNSFGQIRDGLREYAPVEERLLKETLLEMVRLNKLFTTGRGGKGSFGCRRYFLNKKEEKNDVEEKSDITK